MKILLKAKESWRWIRKRFTYVVSTITSLAFAAAFLCLPWLLIGALFAYEKSMLDWPLKIQPQDICLPAPIVVACFFAVIGLAIWFGHLIRLALVEFRLSGNPVLWFFPGKFIRRYAHVRWAPLLFSLFSSCYIFAVGIPIAGLAIHAFADNMPSSHPSYDTVIPNGADSDVNHRDSLGDTAAIPGGIATNAKHESAANSSLYTRSWNDLSVFSGPGIIVIFCTAVVSIFSLVNTFILRQSRFRPIETLDELYDLVSQALNRTSEWRGFSRRGTAFYYVMDYTIATGHMSAEISQFDNFICALKRFLSKQVSGICYRGLICSKNRISDYYQNLAPSRGLSVPSAIMEGNDICAYYLSTSLAESPPASFHIRYEPYHENELATGIRPLFSNEGLCTIAADQTHKNQWCLTNDQIQRLAQSPFQESFTGYVVQTSQIGLTRFIVSNAYLVLFVAATQDHSRATPAGFYSEDPVLIERFKSVFEHYWRLECGKAVANRKG